jgi:hypothetical protein
MTPELKARIAELSKLAAKKGPVREAPRRRHAHAYPARRAAYRRSSR